MTAPVPSPRVPLDELYGRPRARDARRVKQLNAAVTRYLDRVAGVCEQSGIAVLGAETDRSGGVFTATIHLAGIRRYPATSHRQPLELRWNQSAGWHAVAGGQLGGRLRYLAPDLTPTPEQVARFAERLLRGADAGAPLPPLSRPAVADPASLVTALAAATTP